jgi:hypothetical protein
MVARHPGVTGFRNPSASIRAKPVMLYGEI